MMRACGYCRASAAAAVRRSADSLSATSWRASETSGVMAPPSTTMPAGASPLACQAGNRSSKGRSKAFPIGRSPRTASTTTLAVASQKPARRHGVSSNSTPSNASEMIKLEGLAKNPRIFESAKNTPGLWLWIPGAALRFAARRAGMTGLGRFVARPGFSIHGIEARQLRATLDLFDNPRLHALVLGSLLGDERDEILRNHHGAVVVADDHIAREDRA